MDYKKLDIAISEAHRFISKAVDAKKRIKVEGNTVYITGCKETGACIRSSLDLTRALADLRKP